MRALIVSLSLAAILGVGCGQGCMDLAGDFLQGMEDGAR